MLKQLIDRPVAVTMSLIMVMILGMVSTNLLPVSLIPQVDIPYITVQVSYPAQSARELDESVIKPLRQQLLQVSGLKDIRTETKDGSGVITLTFEHGIKTDYVFIEANEKIDRTMSALPRDMDRPTVIKAGATDIPAFYINLSVKGGDNYQSASDLYPVSDKFTELSDFASHVIVKRIEQLAEVAMVDMSGYVAKEILIIPDRDKMLQMKLSLAEFENAVRGVNISMGNLSIRDGEYQYNVKVQSNATDKREIEEAYLKVAGRVYQVKELAQVVEHPQKRNCIVTSDGADAITLAVIKQSEARMSDLKKGIRELMGYFERDYPDVTFTVTRDQTELLDYSIDNLLENIVIGVILACIVIFMFMKNLRSAFIVVITIPIALVLSMLFFYILHISINIVSLSGLVLGAGMMVDNSIIVIDNITFRWENGYKLREAVLLGAKEVFAPMLSSVLTTCAVFVPLIFLSGIAGTLFYDQAMAVTITLFTSLGVTITVIPVYFYLMYRGKETMPANRYLAKFSFDPVVAFYERGLIFLFRRRWIMWSCFAIAIVGSVFLARAIPKERLPQITYHDVLLNVDWNQRITVEENDRRVAQLVDHISDMTLQTTVMAGTQQFVLGHTARTGVAESVVYIMAKDKVKIEDVEATVVEYLRENFPDAIYGFESSGNIFDMVFSQKEARLVARIRPTNGQPPEPESLNRILSAIGEQLPETEISPVAWQEHILYVAQPEVMALYGVTYSELVSVLRNALNDNKLFTIIQGNFSVPVIVGDNKSGLVEILQSATIQKGDASYPAEMFVKQTRGHDLKHIISGPEGNFYPLDLNVDEKSVPNTMAVVRKAVAADPAFEVSFSGSYFSNRSMMWELIIVLVVALLLLYFILAAQFESILQPLVILSEILTDVFGTLLVMWICGVTFNIMSLIGLIVICGIVINDSILKIDTINQLRKEGMGIKRAVLEAGQRRLKPIVMTSLTTILAIAPFLVRGDMGSDLQYPMSVAVMAGMTVGTIVSVYFIPLFYYAIYRKQG